ncbi:MAG: hypothetical protein R3246_09140 [Acidimicrobiia bacterium]|nr:hypothetical protein [Acidimicrobiia bacterium]
MSAISNYLEDALLKLVFKSTAFSSPGTTHLALYSSNPADDDSGTEISGGSYARQSIPWGAYTNGTGSLTTNDDINFTNMPAVTVSHVAIFDAATGGNMLWYGALTSSKSVNSGDTFAITSGNLTVTLD